MILQADDKTFYPLSSITSTLGRDSLGRWVHFNDVHGKSLKRVVHVHKGYLEYVKVDGKDYYIDDSCTLCS